MNIKALERSVSRSMVIVQSQIVIYSKDKGSNVVLEGKKGLSWKNDRRHIMDHVRWKDENFFDFRRCKTITNIRKYKIKRLILTDKINHECF